LYAQVFVRIKSQYYQGQYNDKYIVSGWQISICYVAIHVIDDDQELQLTGSKAKKIKLPIQNVS
jgi:hypothetical protein